MKFDLSPFLPAHWLWLHKIAAHQDGSESVILLQGARSHCPTLDRFRAVYRCPVHILVRALWLWLAWLVNGRARCLLLPLSDCYRFRACSLYWRTFALCQLGLGLNNLLGVNLHSLSTPLLGTLKVLPKPLAQSQARGQPLFLAFLSPSAS